MNECPAPGCTAAQEPGKFLCRRCWYALPLENRQAINRTWRRVEATPKRIDPKGYLTAVRSYREARDRALAHLAQQQPERTS